MVSEQPMPRRFEEYFSLADALWRLAEEPRYRLSKGTKGRSPTGGNV